VKRIPAIDERYRSLLQKTVRRGHVDLVVTLGAFLEARGDVDWFERRAGLVVLSECWPLSGKIVFTKSFHSKLAALVRAAQARKDRDATGLGFLAYALAHEDRSVLAAAGDDRPLKLLAQAVQRPAKFWEWVAAQPCTDDRRRVIQRAAACAPGDRPHDQAVAQAAAYLALSAPLPETPAAAAPPGGFPYWVVFDRRTAAGKRALRDVARDLHLELDQLEWCFYYFEASLANENAPSPWWARYCRWGFGRHGLQPEEARLLWEPAKLQLAEALAEDSRTLQAELYAWKLAHRDRVEVLKRQIELFLDRIQEVPRDQPELF
jgi:hypothetical protein